ncbi:hypothetical protein SASC598J21_005420, partial [Snodgrassella alvi SCGC AB-598-J21]
MIDPITYKRLKGAFFVQAKTDHIYLIYSLFSIGYSEKLNCITYAQQSLQ